MSNFRRLAINPKTGKVERATFIDDAFGRHQYGVLFDDEPDVVYREKSFVATVDENDWRKLGDAA